MTLASHVCNEIIILPREDIFQRGFSPGTLISVSHNNYVWAMVSLSVFTYTKIMCWSRERIFEGI